MGIRESLNKNPQYVTYGTIAIIIVVLVVIFFQVKPASLPAPANAAWYSDDDGTSWFADEINKVTPFINPKTNREAVSAYVYECPDGKFVAFLEKPEPAVKAKWDEWLKKNPGKPLSGDALQLGENGMLVKKPKDKTAPWVKAESEAGGQLRVVKCKDGSIPNPVPAKK